MMHLAMAALLTLAQNDQTQANSYDDAWEAAWKAHCQAVLSGGSGKTPGFVIHIGDSITYSSAYGSWIRSGTGKTTEDGNIITWFAGAGTWPGTLTPTSTNGIYLANVDVVSPKRSMTAAGGIATNEYLSGTGNGSLAMPSTSVVATAQGYVINTSYDGDLHITTVAAAFSAAQFAVVMLGTNDCTASRTAAAFIADLQSIVAVLEAQHIAVILSTIPPHWQNPTLGQQYNDEIRSFASSHSLPLIDFYAEITARRPTDWNGTLLGTNDVHPTGSGGGYDLTSNPYASAGVSPPTGAACTYVGYLLRAWLTVQKLKEVKSYVIDNAPVPTPPAGGSSGACGLTGLEAAILLALLAAYRKSGF
jgi:hypothetical protein